MRPLRSAAAGEASGRAAELTGRRRLRPLFWPGLMTLLMLAVLLGLGLWQVRRLAWKSALLHRIDAAEAAPALPLTSEPSPFAKVRVQGRYISRAQALYGVAVHDTGQGPRMGADLLMPLRPAGGGPAILVDRGWVPQAREQAIPLPENTVTVEGFVRPAQRPGLFSPQDDLAGRHFFTLDPAAVGAALGITDLRPFTLVALGGHPEGEFYPDPARHLPRPDNNHLSYAITWFGLAAALVVIFVVYARRVLRP